MAKTRKYNKNTKSDFKYKTNNENASLLYVATIFLAVFCFIAFILTIMNDNPSERELHDYANEQYQKAFESSSNYENNILFLYVIDPNRYDTLDAIAWVGDNIPSKTNLELDGYRISKHINTRYYKYQLSSGIAMSIEDLTSIVEPAENPSTRIHTVENNSTLDINTVQIKNVVQKFAIAKGYGVSVVIADYSDVYASALGSNIMLVLLGAGFVTGVILFIIQRRKQKTWRK